jgi:DNA polymerase-3 subunit alpha
MKTLKLDPKISEKKYLRRMNRELAAFEAVPGMANFLLINADICAEARRRGIRMGPGRGSVCGTFVGYLIRIHKVDSVKRKLLFERFLNPDRPKMPDIDHDFQASRRPEMFEYTEKKYGKANVMRVGAYQRMKMKKTFKSLAMTYGIPFQTSNKLSKSIIEDEEGNAFFATTKGAAPIEQIYPELYASLQALIGLKTGVARHAAGVIIFDPDDPIRKLIPEMRIADDSGTRKTIDYVSQYDLVAAGDIGLMKQDFLGLRTLDTIQECIDLVKARHGIDVEPDDWDPGEEKGDDKVWKMLRDGFTAGVFQMEGGANHRGIQEIKCGEFEDVVSCTSLYRAGPMIAGAPKRFLKNKKDKKVRVAHKAIEQYMADSWGEMIYQEQMFQMLNEAAGLSWAQVDDVKTAMARKDPVKMGAVKEAAVAGFMKVSEMSEEKATEVWNQIQAQAAYLFNRSHAVAYSVLTYQTARLMMLYPLEFTAALLRTVVGSSDMVKDKRESYLNEALRREFKIMPPDVNVSDDRFMPSGKNELLFGLTDIKGVGAAAVTKLLTYRSKKKIERPEQVAFAVNNSGVMNALSAAGALRSIGVDPDTDKQEELLRWAFEDRMVPFREKYKKRVALPGKAKDGKVSILGEIRKVEKRTTKNDTTFYQWTIRYAPGEDFRIQVWDSASELFSLLPGSVVIVSGKWSPTYRSVGVSNSESVDVPRRITQKILAKKEKAV